MPKISQHSYDIAVVAVRQDHTSGVSVLKVYRPCVWLSVNLFTYLHDCVIQSVSSSTKKWFIPNDHWGRKNGENTSSNLNSLR